MTDSIKTQDDILQMINDTGRLTALRNAGDLSGFAV